MRGMFAGSFNIERRPLGSSLTETSDNDGDRNMSLDFTDEKLELRWRVDGLKDNMRMGAQTLVLWTLILLGTRTIQIISRPSCLTYHWPPDVLLSARLAEYFFLLSALVPLVVCCFRPRPVLYLPIVVLHFVYLLGIAFPPYAYSCQELFELAICDTGAKVKRRTSFYHLDCTLQGHTAQQMCMTWILITPRIIPRLRMMHFTWMWVLIGYVGVTAWQRWQHSEEFFSAIDISISVAMLGFTQIIATQKKFYLEKSERNRFIYDIKQREASEKMFHILEYMVPVHVIGPMLKNPGAVIAEPVNRASILFIMICDFEQYALKMSPKELLGFLNFHFTEMDHICQDEKVTKIETVGEEYVAAVGVVPDDVAENDANGHGCVLGRLIRAAAAILKTQEEEAHPHKVEFKMGMHSGPIVAGVIGSKLPRFRLFGDTINTAARMMQKGLPGELQFGEETRSDLPDWVQVKPRGKVEMKGKGQVSTFLLDQTSVQRRKTPLDADRQSTTSSAWSRTGGGKRKSLVSALLVQKAAAEEASAQLDEDEEAADKADKANTEPPRPNTGESARADSVPRKATDQATEVELTTVSDRMRNAASAPHILSRDEELRQQKLGDEMLRSPSGKVRYKDEVKQRKFEQVLEEINLDRLNETRRGLWSGFSLDKHGFTAEMEQQWFQWYHENVICKKLGKRLDTQALFFSVLTMIDTIYMVASKAADRDHELYTSTLRFPVFLATRALAFFIVMAWRVVASSSESDESFDWVKTAPKDVQLRILVSYMVIGLLMFFSYDAMSTPMKETLFKDELDDIKEQLTKTHIREKDVFSLLLVPIFFIVITSFQLLFLPTCMYILVAASLMGLNYFEGFRGLFFSTTGKVLFIINSVMNAYLAHNSEQTSRARYKAKHAMDFTHDRIATILNTLMPPLVVDELRELPVNADQPSHLYKRATIAQSDLCGFTKLASTRKPSEVVTFIGELFGLFDDLTNKYEIYKVETIGDAYIAGQADYPLTLKYKPISVILFGLDMIRVVHEWSRTMGEAVSCRVGVHTGECIGGIVGTEMQRYHLFGGLMRGLEVLESTAPEGRLQVSKACREACLVQMMEEMIPKEVLMFEEREGQLQTSKGEIIDYEEVGGPPTYVVKSYLQLRGHIST